MKRSFILLILIIILPALSYIVIYNLSKSKIGCLAKCEDKECGEPDGCGGKCKTCPIGQTCDGKKCKIEYYSNSDKPRGICYFDIDGTLTDAKGDTNEIVQKCLDNNFAIGIITASTRKLSHICDGDKPTESWMPSKLCEQFNKNDGKMFNSLSRLAGKPVRYPDNYINYGFIKAHNMINGRDKFYPHLQDKCLVLFDDDPNIIQSVHSYNPSLETRCSGSHCGVNLSTELVSDKIEKMILNGC